MKPCYELTTCPNSGVIHNKDPKYCPIAMALSEKESSGYCVGNKCMAFIQCDTAKGVCGMIPSIHIFLGALK